MVEKRITYLGESNSCTNRSNLDNSDGTAHASCGYLDWSERGRLACFGRCHEVCMTDDRHGRIEECLNFKQLMQRNRRGFKSDEIRSIINRVASCCIAFPRCRHIYRNTIRLPSLLSSLAVAIIMTTRNDAFVVFIGVCHEKMSSLLLRTTFTGLGNN